MAAPGIGGIKKQTVDTMRNSIVLGLAVLLLAGCASDASKSGDKMSMADKMANISLDGTPNALEVGPVDPDSATVSIPVGGKVIIGGFRSRRCGDPAPDFATFMEDQVEDGLSVPDGLTLYDAGIGQYNSGRCNGKVAARAIGARVSAAGSYELRFFSGQVVKKVSAK